MFIFLSAIVCKSLVVYRSYLPELMCIKNLWIQARKLKINKRKALNEMEEFSKEMLFETISKSKGIQLSQ